MVGKTLRRLGPEEPGPVYGPDNLPSVHFLDRLFDGQSGNRRPGARGRFDHPADQSLGNQRPDAVVDQDDPRAEGLEMTDTVEDGVLAVFPPRTTALIFL